MEATGQRFDRIVFATGSGGTQAGMLAGATLTGCHGEILVISVSNDPVRLRGAVADLATETMQ
jgi:L-cysteate sulfo-lyase